MIISTNEGIRLISKILNVEVVSINVYFNGLKITITIKGSFFAKRRFKKAIKRYLPMRYTIKYRRG